MPKCNKCGKNVSLPAKFCKGCGSKIDLAKISENESNENLAGVSIAPPRYTPPPKIDQKETSRIGNQIPIRNKYKNLNKFILPFSIIILLLIATGYYVSNMEHRSAQEEQALKDKNNQELQEIKDSQEKTKQELVTQAATEAASKAKAEVEAKLLQEKIEKEKQSSQIIQRQPIQAIDNRSWFGFEIKGHVKATDTDNYGIVIGRIFQNSPADQGGLSSGDVIITINNNKINDPNIDRVLSILNVPIGSPLVISFVSKLDRTVKTTTLYGIKKTMSGSQNIQQNQGYSDNSKKDCAVCGTVESIKIVDSQGETSNPPAAIANAFSNLATTNNGNDGGRAIADIFGAIAGQIASKSSEKNSYRKKWELSIIMDDGNRRVILLDYDPGLRVQDRVNLSNNSIRRIN